MIELTTESIQSKVLESPLPVAVFFTSPSCGPCRAVYPLLESLVAEYADRLSIVKAVCEEVDEWRQELKIMSIPRIVIFSQGKEVKRIDPRNKGDMRLEFDAVSASVAVAADAAAEAAALQVYHDTVAAAKVEHTSANESVGSWWASIVGEASDATDTAWKPINDATDEALANDAAYQALDDEAKSWAWVRKRMQIEAEDRFAAVREQIAAADATFEAACEPHIEERGRRYKEAESAYETAIQSARLVYKEKIGAWPNSDLKTAA